MAAVKKKEVTIRFAGDSGDGIQFTGFQFSHSTAKHGNDLSTFPDFPAEIRAPQGTVAGVSGFQIQFGSHPIKNPGDLCDVLVVMNAAALKGNLRVLKKGGTIIANSSGFDTKNLRLAHSETNALEDGSLDSYSLISIDITSMTRKSLAEMGLSNKDMDRSKNMFVLGLILWMYHRSLDESIDRVNRSFQRKPKVAEANILALKAGYNFGITSELFENQIEVSPAKLPSGNYRSITGNVATALGLVVAAQKAGLPLFYAGYPITPASDILHEISKHKQFGATTFQAEDEIAAISAAIGASFGGALGVTASSGPGIALKQEALGLAFMMELPLVVCNIQRGGPSTGLPTKTEQADLMQALYGRNGEAPVPVIAPKSPSDCFDAAIEACRIAIQHMTPVILLSDAYLANGAQPWKYPQSDEIKEIEMTFAQTNGEEFQAYKRDKNLVRPWAIPGTPELMHRLGGLEKKDISGEVSYDPTNHEHMVKTRQEKVNKIAATIPSQVEEITHTDAKVAVLSWGGTFGSIYTAVEQVISEGTACAHIHLRYINPFPENLGELLRKYEKVIVAELNNGQLIHLIRSEFLIDAIPFNKIQGLPFNVHEIVDKIREVC